MSRSAMFQRYLVTELICSLWLILQIWEILSFILKEMPRKNMSVVFSSQWDPQAQFHNIDWAHKPSFLKLPSIFYTAAVFLALPPSFS